MSGHLSGVTEGCAECPSQHPPWPCTCVRLGVVSGVRKKGTPSTLPTWEECLWSPRAGHSSNVRCTWSCSGKAGEEEGEGEIAGVRKHGWHGGGVGGPLTRPGLELEEGTAPCSAQHPVACQRALHVLPGQAAASWGWHWHHLQSTFLSTSWGMLCAPSLLAPPYHGSVLLLLPAQPSADLALHLRRDSHGDSTAG